MRKYLDTLLDEKRIDLNTPIEVMGESGMNYMTIENVVDAICITTREEQETIKGIFVQVDFINGNTLGYFNHLAQALAV